MNHLTKNRLLAVLGLLMLALMSTQASAIMISLSPASQTAEPTDMVGLDLMVSGLNSGGADSLGDFDIDIGFDTSALSFMGYSLGTGLGDVGLAEAVDFSFGDLGGLINLSEVSLLFPFELDALQPDSFTLATLDFMVDVLNPGSSTIVFIDQVWAIGDGFGQVLQVDGLGDAVIRNPQSVGVPEPQVLALLSVGLIGIGFMRRLRQQL